MPTHSKVEVIPEICYEIPPTFDVLVELPGRTETIPFYSEFTAKMYANKYRKCADVKRALVINGITGEVLEGYSD